MQFHTLYLQKMYTVQNLVNPAVILNKTIIVHSISLTQRITSIV